MTEEEESSTRMEEDEEKKNPKAPVPASIVYQSAGESSPRSSALPIKSPWIVHPVSLHPPIHFQRRNSDPESMSSPVNALQVELIQTLNTIPTKQKQLPLRKNRVACLNCQARKQRCDEKRPCSRCMRNGRECLDRAVSTITVKNAILPGRSLGSSFDSVSSSFEDPTASSMASQAGALSTPAASDVYFALDSSFGSQAGLHVPRRKSMDFFMSPSADMLSTSEPTNSVPVYTQGFSGIDTPALAMSFKEEHILYPSVVSRRSSLDSLSSKAEFEDNNYYLEFSRLETPDWLQQQIMQHYYNLSPMRLDEWLRTRLAAHRFVLSYCMGVIGTTNVQNVKTFAIDSALSVTRPDYKEYFYSLRNAKLPAPLQYTFGSLDYSAMSSECVENICNVFNVRHLEASDLAVITFSTVISQSSVEQYESHEQVAQVSMNRVFEKLMGCSIAEFAQIFNSRTAEKSPSPLLWFFQVESWSKIQIFGSSSIKADTAVFMENFQFVSATGMRIPVCLYGITNCSKISESNSDILSTQTFVLRPLSATFAPSRDEIERVISTNGKHTLN